MTDAEDAEFEAMIREALAAETEIIVPSPDGLERIRARVGAPRRWYAHAAEIVLSLAIAALAVAAITWGCIQILMMILHGYAR
jgi:hypothetical protein